MLSCFHAYVEIRQEIPGKRSRNHGKTHLPIESLAAPWPRRALGPRNVKTTPWKKKKKKGIAGVERAVQEEIEYIRTQVG